VAFFAWWIGASGQESRGASPSTFDLSNHFRYPVAQVLDGDTIVIRYESRGVPMQLRGVKAVRPAARKFLQELLGGEQVNLVYAPQCPRDRGGHLAAYLFRDRDKLFVNAAILENGYGITNDDDGPHDRLFRVVENDARAERRDLWSEGDLRKRAEPSWAAQAELATTIERRAARRERWRTWNDAIDVEALEAEAAAELGTSTLTVRNNRKEKVRVMLRGSLRTVSFIVTGGTSRSVKVINGNRVQVYFRFADEPATLYEGDGVLVDNNNPTITLDSVHNGNYGVHKIQ
jgi:micrococcal nuclease